MMSKKILFGLIIVFVFYFLTSTSIASLRTIDASKVSKEIISGHLKMGNPGPLGKEIKINNWYMTVGGKPTIEVMGEFHYSRYPKDEWEDILLKMKASGITIVATYVFWNHHEEIEGQFDWSGDKDLRHFAGLCQKHGLYLYPRLGPWCHGEVRNGGTPDWILRKTNVGNRVNEASYQQYVIRLYNQIYSQLKGFLYKDNGPVIGIQLENEYRRGKGGEPHMLWLKQAARDAGFDVPMYTITGWGNVSAPADELIPLFGGYPEAPWQADLEQNGDLTAFLFESTRDIGAIGYDIEKKKDGQAYGIDYSRYPFFTCEIGLGNQLSQHRRPILSPADGYAIVTAKIGSGSNLLGYYVYAGGINPTGVYTTLEEDNAMTGDYNDYPDISYDFQTAIMENGELAPSYFRIKRIHYFLNNFGDRLAPAIPVYAKCEDPKKDLQWSVRVSGNSGFLFATNYMREFPRTAAKDVQFEVKLKDETLLIPSKPVTIADSSAFIWPINFSMGNVNLKYASAQPLTVLNNVGHTDWAFFEEKGIPAEFCFNETGISEIESNGWRVSKKNGFYLVDKVNTGLSKPLIIKEKDGNILHILVLSQEESLRFWNFRSNGRNLAFLSASNMYMDGDMLHVYGSSANMDFVSLNGNKSVQMGEELLKPILNGEYPRYKINLKPISLTASIKPVSTLGNAIWLKTSPEKYSKKRILDSKIFYKEFSLGDPSEIRSGVIMLATTQICRIQVNNRWINQAVIAGKFNRLDLTGYLKKGENKLVITFPFTDKPQAFAAKLDVYYYNESKICISTDASWLTTESYKLSSEFSPMRGWVQPVKYDSLAFADKSFSNDYSGWMLILPEDADNLNLNNLYLHIKHTGDKAKLYKGNKLVGDNFNIPGQDWRLQLKRFGKQLVTEPFTIDVLPFKKENLIRFDQPLKTEDIGAVAIQSVKLIPDYKVVLKLN